VRREGVDETAHGVLVLGEVLALVARRAPPRDRHPVPTRATVPASTRAVTWPPETVTSVSGLAPMSPSTA
jgi:hypothetical protein